MTASSTESLARGPGPLASYNVIGEVTEGLHKLLLEGYNLGGPPPRIEEDLSFVPKDREEVIYIYMYRAAQNPNLLNEKRWRPAHVEMPDSGEEGGPVLYQRPPLIMDIFYMIAVHSKFRSDTERLLGWVLMTLWEQPVLIRRPRRFLLPDGRAVDSRGRDWNPAVGEGDGVHVERVALALVDDMTIGDAINFCTIHEAPYRPFLTYRARLAMLGSMIAADGLTQIKMPRATPASAPVKDEDPGKKVTRSGRIKSTGDTTRKRTTLPGPTAHDVRKLEEPPSEPESED